MSGLAAFWLIGMAVTLVVIVAYDHRHPTLVRDDPWVRKAGLIGLWWLWMAFWPIGLAAHIAVVVQDSRRGTT